MRKADVCRASREPAASKDVGNIVCGYDREKIFEGGDEVDGTWV